MIAFPLLLIPLAIYNIIAFLMRDVAFDKPIFQFVLKSGDEWPLTLSDMLLTLGIVLLLFEVIKGARPGSKYLTDHLLSALVFGGAVAEFVLLPRFGTPTFFLLTMLTLVEFFSGIALRTRRNARVVVSDTRASQKTAQASITDPPAPHIDPAPAPIVREEPLVVAAKSAPAMPVEPVVLHAGVVSSGPSPDIRSAEVRSPEIRSPDLQPDAGAHPSTEPPLR